MHARAHTCTRLTALCPELPGSAGTRKVNQSWILLKQETASGSGISWAICKSAPCSRVITMITTQFFTGQMPFLPPNQQRQSTEGIYHLLISHMSSLQQLCSSHWNDCNKFSGNRVVWSKLTCVSGGGLLAHTADISLRTAVSGTQDVGIRLFIIRWQTVFAEIQTRHNTTLHTAAFYSAHKFYRHQAWSDVHDHTFFTDEMHQHEKNLAEIYLYNN